MYTYCRAQLARPTNWITTFDLYEIFIRLLSSSGEHHTDMRVPCCKQQRVLIFGIGKLETRLNTNSGYVTK